MLVVDVEGFTTGNVHHLASVQVIDFFRMRHDEVTRPKQTAFLLGKWNGHHRERPDIILETAKAFPGLRCCDWYGHDGWLLQPRWWPVGKTKFPREDEVPRLINPWRQVFFPFPVCPSLPVSNRVGRLQESQSVAGRLADEQPVSR